MAEHASTGVSDTQTVLIQAADYRENVPVSPPAPGERYPTVATPHGAVRVAPPRGRRKRSGLGLGLGGLGGGGTDDGGYPAPPKGPAVPRHKAPAPRRSLAYYPQWHTDGHPTRWEFPAYLDNPSCAWLQVIKRLYADAISFPASLSPEAGLLVHSLVRNIRPKVVIETGTFIGMSSLWIASALEENGDGGVLHTFDDFSPIRKGPWREVEMPSGRLAFVAGLLAEAGLGNRVVLHPGNSSFEIRASHDELREAGGAQLAFLDADHGIVGVNQDMWATEPVLPTGGFVLLHDTFPEYCSHEGPRNLLDHVNEIAVGVYEKVDLYLSPINYGLGLLRRVG